MPISFFEAPSGQAELKSQGIYAIPCNASRRQRGSLFFLHVIESTSTSSTRSRSSTSSSTSINSKDKSTSTGTSTSIFVFIVYKFKNSKKSASEGPESGPSGCGLLGGP